MVPDVRKAPLQVLLDPDPAVNESEQEPNALTDTYYIVDNGAA